MMSIIKVFKKVNRSLIIYILSVGSYFFVDIYISKNFEIMQVANWAYLKSILFIAVVFVLLGLDKSLIRHPGFFKNYTKYLPIQIPVLALVISYFFYYLQSQLEFVDIFFPVLLLSILMAFQAAYRSFLFFSLAQVAANLWKLMFLLFIVCSFSFFDVKNISLILDMSLAVVLIYLIYKEMGMKFLKVESTKFETVEGKEALTDGAYFLFHAILFNVAISIEQILLNQQQLYDKSAQLLAHSAVYLPMIIALNGFLGFFIGPMIRNRGLVRVSEFKKTVSYYSLFGIVLIFLSYGLGTLAFEFLFEEKYEIDKLILIFVLFVGFLRYLYVVPSSIIGMLGSSKVLKMSFLYYFLSTCIYIISFFLLLEFDVDKFEAVLLAGMIHWFLRVFFGFILSIKELTPDEH